MSNIRAMARGTALILGPIVAVLLGVAGRALDLPTAACWTAAITGLTAAWWVTEPIPIPATSLIPFAALPLAGVLDHKQVASAYGHTLILLLLGGFILSTAMERSGAHRRIALGMVRLVGGKDAKRLVLGFMIATGTVSMWISNTATTLMMLPVALAVIQQDKTERLAVPLLLGIAYSASLGGLGTPVGTPPNVIFLGVYKETQGVDMSFVDWMKIGVPAALVMIPAAWAVLTRGLKLDRPLEIPPVGPWRPIERRVMGVFACTAALWVTRSEPLGGWTGLLGLTGVGDSTVALAAVIAMFLIPSGEPSDEDQRSTALLDWKTAATIPWGLLILFGGGIALAKGFTASGLSNVLGQQLSGLATLPLVLTLLCLCLAVTFLTEVTSNTATATLLMPVLAAAGAGAGLAPELLMIPAALSASCAFMLPVATAPNAIVFGTGRVASRRMAREGLVLNLVGAVVVSGLCYALLG